MQNSHQHTMSVTLLLSATAGAVAGTLGLAWYASNVVNPQPRRPFYYDYTFTPWELQVPFEDVTLTAIDGLTLRGWWLPRPASRSVVIGSHGHLGAKHELLGIGASLWRAGHNVLLFDYRGRGSSDTWPNTLVSREVDDLLVAVEYVATRNPDARIGVIGFSMGAAVAIMAAAQDQRIAAVVADSPFTSATDIIGEQMRRILHIPARPLVTLTGILVERRFGYRINRVRPIDAVRNLAPRPLLVVHGTADSLIPVSHGQRVFDAAGQPKELWLCEGADHCGIYFQDRSAYVARMRTFFDQYLLSVT